MTQTLVGAAVLAATLGASGQALAALTHDFGTVTGTEDATLADTFAGDQFFLYTFQVNSTAQVFGAWSATPVAYAYEPTQYAYAANGLAGGFSLLGGSFSQLQYYSSSGNGADSFSFVVDPGSYTLKFNAFTTPYDRAALFTTHASVSAVSAVPEPQTVALLLAGLVTTGFLARRRVS